MTTTSHMGDKAGHVRQAAADERTTQRKTRHTCHWPGCGKSVPPAMWGCARHWFTLPKNLRDLIWQTYQPGQEISKTPSREYVVAARQVREWIEQNHPFQADTQQPLL